MYFIFIYEILKNIILFNARYFRSYVLSGEKCKIPSFVGTSCKTQNVKCKSVDST